MATRSRRPSPRTQQGFTLIVLLAIITMMSLYGIVSQLDPAKFRQAQLEGGENALSQAKIALLGWAASQPNDPYLDCSNSADCPRFGELPCPDNRAPSDINAGYSASGTCSGTALLGRLPFRSLGIERLMDGNAEPLWYAVAPEVATGSSRSVPLNSDTAGTIQIKDAQGNLIADDVMAVIIAPGPALSNQNRANTTTASNYLESGNSVYPTGNSLTTGPLQDKDNVVILNDQMVYITRTELMAVAEKRLLAEVRDCLSDYGNEYGNYPWPSPFSMGAPKYEGLVNTSYFGRIPKYQTLQPGVFTTTLNNATAALAAFTTASESTLAGTITTLSSSLRQVKETVSFILNLAQYLADKSGNTSYTDVDGVSQIGLKKQADKITSTSDRDQKLAEASSTIKLAAPALSTLKYPDGSMSPAFTQYTDSKYQQSLSWMLVDYGIDVYPYHIDRYAADLVTSIANLQQKLTDLVQVRNNYEADPSFDNGIALYYAARDLRTAIGSSTSTSGTRYYNRLLNNLIQTSPATRNPGLRTSDATILSSANTASTAASAADTSAALARSSAGTGTTTTMGKALTAAGYPANVSYQASAIAQADDTIAKTNTALTQFNTVVSQASALTAAIQNARPNISPKYLMPWASTLLDNANALLSAAASGDKDAMTSALNTTKSTISSVNAIIPGITSGSTSVSTSKTAASTALDAATDTINTALATTNASNSNTAASKSKDAVTALSSLIVAMENTNVTWSTLVAITSNETWVTWRSATNLTLMKTNYEAGTGTSTSLNNTATEVSITADRISQYANYLLTLASGATSSLDNALGSLSLAASTPDSGNITAAATAARGAINSATQLNSAFGQGQNASSTLPVLWTTTGNNGVRNCKRLFSDNNTFGWHQWRNLIFYQRTAAKTSASLTVNGTGNYSLVAISAGPPLSSQQDSANPKQRKSAQNVGTYFEDINAHTSRNETAPSPNSNFVSKPRSTSFNDQLATAP